MVGLVRGPTGIRCAPGEQDRVGGGGGDARVDSPSPGRVPSSLLALWTTQTPSPENPPPPKDQLRAGNRSAPRS